MSETSTDPVSRSNPQCPSAFVYFDEAERPSGIGLTKRLEKLAKADLRLPPDVVSSMGRALDQGDRLGDAWYADARSRGSVRQAREEFNTAVQGLSLIHI